MKTLRRAAVLLALALGAPSAFAARVEISRAPDKSYEVEGSFTVKASSSAVWAVLTDYDRIGGFVKSMKTSRVVASRIDGTTVVEQEAVGGVLIFSRKVKVLLEIRREPGRLTFIDVGREDFWDYSGSWSVTEGEEGAQVVYRLSALPDFIVPPS
ncbi:MAG: SRPBCC family protein [Elusimicrobiota bacterium]|nr:MAG: SRPBCC family protein [Elusimicrobiota bacterium]